jgi:hypothetical protein
MNEPNGVPCTLEIPPGGSRRLLLHGVALGLASTAGLILPARSFDGADAADHPAHRVQQRNERHRRKQRNSRDRRTRGREGKDRKHDSSPPPGLGPSGIKMKVLNKTATNFDVKYWLGTFGWESQESDLPSQGTLYAGTEDLHLGIEFLTERLPFIWVENPLAGTPNTTFQYGGAMHFVGYIGGTVEVNHGTLEVDAETAHSIPFTSTRSYGVKVRRESNIPAFKVFTMTITES